MGCTGHRSSFSAKSGAGRAHVGGGNLKGAVVGFADVDTTSIYIICNRRLLLRSRAEAGRRSKMSKMPELRVDDGRTELSAPNRRYSPNLTYPLLAISVRPGFAWLPSPHHGGTGQHYIGPKAASAEDELPSKPRSPERPAQSQRQPWPACWRPAPTLLGGFGVQV